MKPTSSDDEVNSIFEGKVQRYRECDCQHCLLLTVSVNSYVVNFLVFVDSLRRTFVICVLSTNIGGNI